MKNWQELLDGYLNNNLTSAELEMFLQQADDHSDSIAGTIGELLASGELQGEGDPLLRNKLLEQLLEKIDQPVEPPVRKISFLRKPWVRAAAVVLLTASLVALTWFLKDRSEENIPADRPAIVQDAAPAREGAILTLADGRSLLLDSLPNGIVTTDGNTKIELENGQISYSHEKDTAGTVRFNTMQTPRGRTFHIQLPDGTMAWLNAASSITYPVQFKGKERNVSVQGEVYFEVAKNASMPFRVTVNDRTTVEVLGTHFNVNAYADEPLISTTLLEGSVRVVSGNSVILKPGEVASQSNSGAASVIRVQPADTDAVMAWKNNRFHFNHTDIPTIMRQLARWYDVDIVYEGAVPTGHFNGKPSRNLSASQVLTLLQHIGVNCRIEGKKIIVAE
ncbi:FecR family protein [Pseudobacter ginsenosidimutans]|uniref:FecR family protein n=1 Tax=Pseudobacter ginsenosidimutans TaxID=661488 RepID=A0A4Q7N1M5_9BACT|nr:FecR family protein [Pseudobacter ginsenosidimutans]QEC43126.1 DUF4974 domain-containing protein [Pseudobacter ginsenosidimutans]RZS74484.1 FecR family protein [Pseudobacter ginsenosidimutans]